MPLAALVCFCETTIFLCGTDDVKLRLPLSALHWLCTSELSSPVVGRVRYMRYWYPGETKQGWRRDGNPEGQQCLWRLYFVFEESWTAQPSLKKAKKWVSSGVGLRGLDQN